MATTKPRITVTLTPRQYEVLRVISECGGQPMSGFISEMLELSLPTLERMASSFQKIKASQDLERSRVVQALDDAQQALEPMADAAIDQLNLMFDRMEDSAIPKRQGASDGALGFGSASSPPQPPTTNRGVTPHLSKPSKASLTKAFGGISKSKSVSKVKVS